MVGQNSEQIGFHGELLGASVMVLRERVAHSLAAQEFQMACVRAA